MQDTKDSHDRLFLSGDKKNVICAFDRIAEAGTYDELYKGALPQAEDRLLSKYLIAALPAGSHVLDVGCGTGLFLHLTLDYLLGRAYAYTGLDISPGMLSQARAQHPGAHFVEGDVERMPLPDTSFDAAVALYGTPSYWPNPIRALGEIRRVLRPGGTIFLMPYTLRWFWQGIEVMGDVNIETSPAPWMPDQTHQRLKQAGFKGVRLRAFSLLPSLVLRYEHLFARHVPQGGRYMIVEGMAA